MSGESKALTAFTVAKAKPKATKYKLAAGGGLHDAARVLKEHGGNGYFAKTKGWAAMEASMRREIAAKWLAIFVIPCALLWLTIRWIAQGLLRAAEQERRPETPRLRTYWKWVSAGGMPSS